MKYYVMTMLKAKILFLMLFGIFLFTALVPRTALAAFNRSEIISNPEFLASNTMTEGDIQYFLASRGSSLRNYVEAGNVMIGPNNTVNSKGWSAARIINQSAKWYGISPQVILVTLQKEESLITLSNPEQWRLNSAMGYGCPDSGGCNPSFIGFTKQVDNATWQLRFNYERSGGNTAWWPGFGYYGYMSGGTYAIDYVQTYIGNQATASLYTYTPHFSGNQSFYNLYAGWFDPIGLFPVVASLSFSDLNPAVGEPLNVSFAIKNMSDSPVTLNVGAADQNIQTGQWNSVPQQNNISFTAGETKSFTFSKTVLYQGPHRTWISVYYNGSWYSAKSYSGQLVSYNYYVRPTSDVIKVSSSIGFSNLSPAAGETLTAVYTLTNYADAAMTIDAGLADQNTQTGQWNSFTPQAVLIPKSGQKQVIFNKKVMYPGSHTTWIALGYGGQWSDARPATSQQVRHSYFVRVPNIRLNYYYFDPLPPKANQLFKGFLSVTNLEDRSISIDALGVPIYNLGTKTWNTMGSSAMNFVLAKNETLPLSLTQTLVSGYYSIWPSACLPGYCFTPKNSAGVEMFWRGNVW